MRACVRKQFFQNVFIVIGVGICVAISFDSKQIKLELCPCCSSKKKRRKKEKKLKSKKKRRRDTEEELEEEHDLPPNIDLTNTLKVLRTTSPTNEICQGTLFWVRFGLV